MNEKTFNKELSKVIKEYNLNQRLEELYQLKNNIEMELGEVLEKIEEVQIKLKELRG